MPGLGTLHRPDIDHWPLTSRSSAFAAAYATLAFSWARYRRIRYASVSARASQSRTTVECATWDMARFVVAVAETVQLWNVFRKKAIDEATRKKTVDAALSALTGKLYEASLKHDSARVVQALHKFGDASQRAKIEAELVPRLGELAIRPYARHVALALVKRAADSSQRSTRCRAVRGKFRQIAVHAVGAKVADALLQTAPKRDAMEKVVHALAGIVKAASGGSNALSRSSSVTAAATCGSLFCLLYTSPSPRDRG